jgi:hypothetical protein
MDQTEHVVAHLLGGDQPGDHDGGLVEPRRRPA